MNDTIDDVAREMTASELPNAAGFRRRVLARIDGGGAPRRRWRASFVLTPLAVAAAIVIALFVARERRPGPSGPGEMPGSSRASELGEPVQALPPLVSAGPKGTAATGPTGSGATGPRRPVLRAKAPDAEPQLESSDVASIAVPPLAVDPLPSDSIQIERLDAIAPIAVAPLDIIDPSRRDQ